MYYYFLPVSPLKFCFISSSTEDDFFRTVDCFSETKPNGKEGIQEAALHGYILVNLVFVFYSWHLGESLCSANFAALLFLQF